MRHPHRNGRAAIRRAEAAERQAAYAALTPDARLSRARKAPGRSRRQVERLVKP